jgi:Methyltransferase domain
LTHPGLDISRVRPLIKHPSLLLALPGGTVGIMKAHSEIEIRRLRRRCGKIGDGPLDSIQALSKGLCYNYRSAYLYCVARRLKPEIMVETGVAGGVSSFAILQAFEENGKGMLFSIDMPNATHQLPAGQQAGFLVPERLRKRWRLTLADSRNELPRLLDELKEIDVFCHDSLHTYDHMLFEYELVWPYLRHGGVLLSDDVQENSAFRDFCDSKKLTGKVTLQREKGHKVAVGYLTKP